MLFRSDGNQKRSQQLCREGHFVVGYCSGQTNFYIPRTFWDLTDAEVQAAVHEVFGPDNEIGRFFRDFLGEGWGMIELPPAQVLDRVDETGSHYRADEDKIKRFVHCLERFLGKTARYTTL